MAAESEADWTSRYVYRTLCRLFRITPPFYEPRRLSPKDFERIQAEFVGRAVRRELRARDIGEHSGEVGSARRVQALALFTEIFDWVETHCRGRVYLTAALAQQVRMREDWERRLWAGRLLFADSAEGQRRARQELRALLRGRPTPVKSLCRELLRGIPPKSRKQMGWVQEWLGDRKGRRPSVLRYRAKRQFLWAFLKGEARDGEPAEVARDLARAYPFLGLTAEQIAAGLTNPHQADEDTARYFGRRSVRDALSRRRRAARRASK